MKQKDLFKNGHAFLILPVILISIMVFIPMVLALITSFQSGPPVNMTFNGLGNYQRMLTDATFKKAFFNTFLYLLVQVPIMLFLALFISNLLTFVFAPLEGEDLASFLVGAAIMMIGMTLFLFGADYSMMEVGDLVGKYMIKKKSLTVLVSLGFAIGIVITIAEPSVQVLGQQVYDISDGEIGRVLLIGIVSVGTGVFLAFALLRVVFKLSYYQLMAIGYIGVLIASFFTSSEFMPIAFDSGGVTTGPVTVPFILALAGGMTSMIKQKKNENDSFGMVGIASLGPILAVMILGVIFQ